MNAPAEARHWIEDVSVLGDELLIRWEGGREERIHAIWLRDNCPSAGDRNSAIRSFSLVDLPDGFGIGEISIETSGSLRVIWRPDGHESLFDPNWLAAHLPGRRGSETVTRWDRRSQNALPWIDHDTIEEGNANHLALLESLAEKGFAMVRGIPGDETTTEALLNRAGFVQENDFGRVFNIVSEPDVWELSQSDEALHVHTDDPYRHTPPGISLLHCVEASPEGGGVSVLVDGFAVAERLKETDAKAFELLSSVPVGFIRYREDPVPQGDDVHLFTEAPIISTDTQGSVSGIRYHERSMAPLDLKPGLMAQYYPALIAFTRLLYAEEFQIRHLLQAGEAVMFDNQRVLHGRTEFDGSAGRRHMRLTQTSRDQFQSKLRLLRSRHQQDGAALRLPTGAGW